MSRASFASATSSSSPCSDVIDDVPTFTTASTSDPLDVLELDGTDAHDVTLARARAREGPFDAHLAQPVLDVRDGLLVGEVGHRDHALRGASGDPPGAV